MKKQEGFTLIELMVVILIIGILVAIAVPVFFSAQSNAEEGACKDNLRTIDGCVIQYRAGADDYSLDSADYVPELLKDWPECPAGGTYEVVTGTPPYAVCDLGHTYGD